LEYALKFKRLSPRADLGVTSNLINMIRLSRRHIAEDPLCRALKYLDHEELARLTSKLP